MLHIVKAIVRNTRRMLAIGVDPSLTSTPIIIGASDAHCTLRDRCAQPSCGRRLVPPGRERAAGELHDRPDEVGRLWQPIVRRGPRPVVHRSAPAGLSAD